MNVSRGGAADSVLLFDIKFEFDAAWLCGSYSQLEKTDSISLG